MLKKSLVAIAVLMSTSVLADKPANFKVNTNKLAGPLKIVGGEEVKPHALPYQASIQDLNGSHFCGGSIVGQDLILTAAHCMEGVNGESPNIQVRVGAHSLTDGSGQAIKVAKTYTNQEYPNLSKDVAILKLEQEITDPNTAIIKLADQSFFNANIKEKAPLTVSGWGTLTSGGSMPDKLMAVSVPFVTNEVCNSAEAYSGQIQDTEICAGYKEGGKDSCQGDSGGPLMFAKNNEFYQVGVVSWGDGCAAANKYGVYGNVAALKDWIDSAMAGNEPASGLAGDSGDYGDGDGGEYGEESYIAFQDKINYSIDDEALSFSMEVPEGINVIYIATKGGEGDVDISAEYLAEYIEGEEDGSYEDEYLEFDFEDFSDFYSSENIGNDEMIIIERPQAGEWVISFSDFTNFSDVELTVFAH
ncbi:hypothetical protein tinsulaeT_36310 [Thalassotalea insulae]|uniref:Peptidase S1 domain-containing protein n=1 Tax=Thalassotalea insulae TaxID=2056778 RepID=A0ABQ6GWG8_9GAMM|nr:serine protease [Thalassotalea insulae]GLX80291.1 hypothetical protein tinsulaeT_36310 [Thalassotalea insulae]